MKNWFPDAVYQMGCVDLVSLLNVSRCGTSFIVPQLPALEEVVEEGKTGFLYQPDDFKSLAQKMMLLIEDKEMRRKMGEKGMEVVKEKFEWQKLANRYVKICEDFEGSL